MLDKLEARLEQLGKALENSAQNHNALLGAMAEAKSIYEMAKADAPLVEEVVKDVAEIAPTV